MKDINLRRSVREYSDKDVSLEDIKKILESAMLAPSARNGQPWEFLVVKDQKKKDNITSLVPSMRMAGSASFLVIFLTRKDKLTAPLYYEQDLASSVNYAMLKAYELGIGSVWCGVAPIPEKIKNVRDVFEIKNENLEPFALVCFGYPKKEEAFFKAERFDETRIHFEEL